MGESKYKAIMNIPGWARELSGTVDHVTGTADAYSSVPLIYRAMNLRAESLASVPVVFYRGEDISENPWPGVDWVDLMLRIVYAMDGYGAAYILKLRNRVLTLGLQWLNPATMSIERRRVIDPKTGQDSAVNVFIQQLGTDRREYSADEIIYISSYSPVSDIGPGIAPAAVALTDAQLARYTKRFAAKFFEGGAMPITVIGVEDGNNMQETERDRLENFFKRAVQGIANAWRTLVLAAKTSVSVITPPLKDLALKELNESSLEGISHAFGIRKSILGDPANYATAKEDWESFWVTTIRPLGERIQAAFNTQLFTGLKMRLELAFDEMDVFQTDEAERGASLKNFTDFLSACPTAEIAIAAAEQYGYEWSQELIDAIVNWYAAKDERREALPAEMKPEENATVENEDELKNELKRWQRKSLKSLERGRGAVVGFESDILPPSLSGAIVGALEGATSPEAVRAVFANALEWRAYP